MMPSVPAVELLSRLAGFVRGNLEDGWAAEPPAARLALLLREELARWTRATYAGSACECGAVRKGSRRGLTLAIHAPPATHRVEIWGLACGDEGEGDVAFTPHAAHSWVVLAHLGGECPRLESCARKLESAGLRRVDRFEEDRLSLSLWRGSSAPEGCPACLEKR